MATIDIGPGATDRASYRTISVLQTIIDLNNPANDTGTLDTFEIFANTSNMTNVKIGTFSGSGTSYDDRDYETIGTVTYGSKQTFTGKNCDVSSGDYLGFSADGGKIELTGSGFAGHRRELPLSPARGSTPAHRRPHRLRGHGHRSGLPHVWCVERRESPRPGSLDPRLIKVRSAP